jgi:hypothetical protein
MDIIETLKLFDWGAYMIGALSGAAITYAHLDSVNRAQRLYLRKCNETLSLVVEGLEGK